MKWFLLTFVLCQQPVLALAQEVGEQDTYVSPLQSYQGWQEPVVRDWQETHHLVTAEPSGHAGHSSMAMPDMKNMTNHEGHEGMNHQNMTMPAVSPETMSSSNSHKEGQHK